MSDRTPPPTVLLCSRWRDGSVCLGRVWLDHCWTCGAEGTGALYTRASDTAPTKEQARAIVQTVAYHAHGERGWCRPEDCESCVGTVLAAIAAPRAKE